MQQEAHTSPRRRRRWLPAGLTAGAAVAVAIGGIVLAEPAQAATMFSDTFESGLASTWSKSGGNWAVGSDGTQVLQQTNIGSELAREFNGSTSWTDYSLQASVKPVAFGSGDYVGIWPGRPAAPRSTGWPCSAAAGPSCRRSTAELGHRPRRRPPRPWPAGTWYTLRIDVAGTSIAGFVNGAQVGLGHEQRDRRRPDRAADLPRQRRNFDDVMVVRARVDATDDRPAADHPALLTAGQPDRQPGAAATRPPGGLRGISGNGPARTTGGGRRRHRDRDLRSAS